MTTIFKDRRVNGERRGTRSVAGRIHCRRRCRDRRRYQADSNSRWWLKANYVDKELLVERPLK